MKEILEFLEKHQEIEYKKFQEKLIPNMDSNKIIGVRTVVLRAFAKEILNQEKCGKFLLELPHTYFEENQIHGFLISEIKDFKECMKELELFLPYIDNWATCDQTSPKIFKKHKKELMVYIKKWLKSNRTYSVRFAIGMLMQHFLNEDFHLDYLKMVTNIHSKEYYINMEIAWYMATALAKQWDATIQYLENPVMDKWTHNKTITKAIESRRITDEQKKYLRTLKIK